jgi:hypothetical protein
MRAGQLDTCLVGGRRRARQLDVLAASAVLMNGNATTGRPLPMASVSNPCASVSLMPAAHLLIVLKAAGATTMAARMWPGCGPAVGPCDPIPAH